MDGPDSIGLADPGLGMPDSDLMLEPTKSAFLGKAMALPKKGPKTVTKPTNAPKRFKSSFIFFSMAKHKEIKEQLSKQGDTTKTTNITKMVSDAWRNMEAEERAKYDALARQDKARYELERANYKEEKGSASSKKKQRDPDAPRRPMSAFLSYANSRRAAVKGQNPDCSNGEISKILSTMWKEAEETIKQKYRDEEAALWATYKEGMVEWRKKNDGRKKATKALQAAAAAAASKKRKKRFKDGDDPSLTEASFDEQQFSGLGGTQGLDPTNPNTDEMMAASALRGVRGGPNFPLASGGVGMGGTPAGAGMEGGMQQTQLQQGPAGYGPLFGMNGVNAMNPYGGGVGNPGGNPVASGNFGQEVGNTANRAFLEMGFPYQQYGGYSLGNPQAMLMAQALRGNPGAYHNQLLGLAGEQQPPLSQLASLAGAQNGNGQPPAQTMNMGSMMNDNSSGGVNRVGMGDGNGLNGLSGERF